MDELHLQKPETYSAIKLGLKAQPNTLMVSISTAGDENSEQLHTLEAYGKAAIAGKHERFGFFYWYAPEEQFEQVYDPDALAAANPAVACGRLPAEIDQTIPEHEYTRYILNRHGQSDNLFMPAHLWNACAGEMPPLVEFNKPVFAVDRTANWDWVSITVAKKIDNVVYSQLIAQYFQPDHDFIVAECKKLYKAHGGEFVMDAQMLREVHMNLREKQHIPVEYFNQQQIAQATAATYALASTDRLVHNNDEVANKQRPSAITKSHGDGYRLSVADSTGDIDVIKATAMAVYWADTKQKRVMTVGTI